MKWRGRRESANVEDRRGEGGFAGGSGGGFGFPGGGYGGGGPRMRLPGGGGGRGGGLGIGGLIVLLVILWLLGINPISLLTGEMAPVDRDGAQTQTAGRTEPAGIAPGGEGAPQTEAELKSFVRVVLADTEDVWQRLFSEGGAAYAEPRLVLFSGQVGSACGLAQTASGPFYCPNDRKIYLDMDFFREMATRFSAAGDFADAYVIAHEVGHHVQNLTGILPRYQSMRARLSPTEANALSVKVELQADCLAGVWAHHTDAAGNLEPGDVNEALNAAHQIGDDTLQRRTQGVVVPDSFTHGTAEQRTRWFRAGFDSGRVSACDTFSARQL